MSPGGGLQAVWAQTRSVLGVTAGVTGATRGHCGPGNPAPGSAHARGVQTRAGRTGMGAWLSCSSRRGTPRVPGGNAGPPAFPHQDPGPTLPSEPGSAPVWAGSSPGWPRGGGAGAGGAGGCAQGGGAGGVQGRLGRLHPKGSVAAPAPPQVAQSYCSPFSHCGFDSCP